MVPLQDCGHSQVCVFWGTLGLVWWSTVLQFFVHVEDENIGLYVDSNYYADCRADV